MNSFSSSNIDLKDDIIRQKNSIQFDLDPIFNPNSMAIIGVSSKNYSNPGTIIYLKNLFEMNLGEKTYPINPKGGEIESHQIYTDISKVPNVPDVAVIAVPAKAVLEEVEKCIDQGVKGIIVISGGFAETGKEGKEMQNKITQKCIETKTPLIGPNCVGVYRVPKIDTIFLPTEKLTIPNKGNVAIISQSGGVLLDQFFLSFYERKIGVSCAVSVGNKAVINETHLLDYFARDNETDTICFYIEGFEPLEGRYFLEKSKNITKDIVVYRGGTTEQSIKAVASHTASLSTNSAISRGAFKQFGIIQPQTEEEVLNYVKTYSTLAASKRKIEIPSLMKGRVAIVTVSGGHGVVTMDLLNKYDLKPAVFNERDIAEMKQRVNKTVAQIGSFSNPIDLTGAAADDDIVKIMDFLFTHSGVDIVLGIVVPYPPAISIQIGRRIALTARQYTKPLVCFVPYIEKYDLIRDSLELYQVPVGHTVSETVQMAAAIRDKSYAHLRIQKRNE